MFAGPQEPKKLFQRRQKSSQVTTAQTCFKGVRKKVVEKGRSEKADATGTSHASCLFTHHKLCSDHETTGAKCPSQAPVVLAIIRRSVLTFPICLHTPLGEGEQFLCSCSAPVPHCSGGRQLSSRCSDVLGLGSYIYSGVAMAQGLGLHRERWAEPRGRGERRQAERPKGQKANIKQQHEPACSWEGMLNQPIFIAK